MQQSLEENARRLGHAIGYFVGYNFWWALPLIAVLIALAVWAYRRRRR